MPSHEKFAESSEPSVPSHPRPPGARAQGLRQKSQPKSNRPIRHGYFNSFDGTRLFYSIEGEGLPLLFCYGLVCSSLHWTYQIDYFKDRYQTIWFDYRGHQNSEIPTDLSTLTLETLARDIDCLLEELQIPKVVLLGHSMGVNVVLEFFRLHSNKVTALVLANGTARRPLETMFHVNFFQKMLEYLTAINRISPSLLKLAWKTQKNNPVARSFIGLMGFNSHLTSPNDIELYVNQVADLDPIVLLSLISNYDQYDASPWLHKIKVPTLVIAGEEDKVIPLQQQQLLHQLIPESEIEQVRHGSHCPQMDLPDLVNQRIERFLERLN